MSNGSAWDEHSGEGEARGVQDVIEGHEVLGPALDDADSNEVQGSSRKSGRGGVNPRLLAVILMVAVVGGSGFAFLKMKSRSTVESAVLEPTEQAPVASVDPVPQTPPGIPLGGIEPPTAGGDLLAGAPGYGAASQRPPTFVPDDPGAPGAAPAEMPQSPPPAFVPGVPAASESGIPQTPQRQVIPPSQSAAPVGIAQDPAASRHLAEVSSLLSRTRGEVDRLSVENEQLRKQLSGSESHKPTAPDASGAVAKKPARVQAPSSKRKAVESRREVKAAAASRRQNKVPDSEVITESRESRLANLSVRAIYPLNGRDARAWINVGGDLVEVSAGSTVAGVHVKSISPEKMEVVTDAGVIRAHR